jgi:hypothetical protein
MSRNLDREPGSIIRFFPAHENKKQVAITDSDFLSVGLSAARCPKGNCTFSTGMGLAANLALSKAIAW